MAKDEKFMFYESFMRAIETLPEDKRAEACYEFCRYGIYGELPEDEALKMFCIGVSCSVKKYQGCGGNHNPTGKNQYSKNGQVGQVGQDVQTQTKTEIETQTKTEIENIPTKKQVEDFCRQVAKIIDIDSFMAYYSASNWEDKNGLPVNWQQKVIMWSMKNSSVVPIKKSNDGLF